MLFQSTKRRVEIEWTRYGIIFIRFPWFGEAHYAPDGCVRTPWSEVKAIRERQAARQQQVHAELEQ
jgi:hypothetical protein